MIPLHQPERGQDESRAAYCQRRRESQLVVKRMRAHSSTLPKLPKIYFAPFNRLERFENKAARKRAKQAKKGWSSFTITPMTYKLSPP